MWQLTRLATLHSFTQAYFSIIYSLLLTLVDTNKWMLLHDYI